MMCTFYIYNTTVMFRRYLNLTCGWVCHIIVIHFSSCTVVIRLGGTSWRLFTLSKYRLPFEWYCKIVPREKAWDNTTFKATDGCSTRVILLGKVSATDVSAAFSHREIRPFFSSNSMNPQISCCLIRRKWVKRQVWLFLGTTRTTRDTTKTPVFLTHPFLHFPLATTTVTGSVFARP